FVGWLSFVFFFQAEDGIRDATVTGVQTCALPISHPEVQVLVGRPGVRTPRCGGLHLVIGGKRSRTGLLSDDAAGRISLRIDGRRSEERRVGKECRSRGATYHGK